MTVRTRRGTTGPTAARRRSLFPGMTGGVNWGGTATDPELGYIFVNSKDEPSSGWIAPNPRYNEQTKDTEFPYVQQSGGTLSAEARDADGRSLGTLPCFRPPWASLMAVNAATGEFVWRVPLGVNDNMPEGKKNVGSPGYGGPIVTAGGLVFIGATRDRRFRAFDSRTGKELWSVRFDYNVTAIPITYMGRNGKQYVAVVAATNGQGNNESLTVPGSHNEAHATARAWDLLSDEWNRNGQCARTKFLDAEIAPRSRFLAVLLPVVAHLPRGLALRRHEFDDNRIPENVATLEMIIQPELPVDFIIRNTDPESQCICQRRSSLVDPSILRQEHG